MVGGGGWQRDEDGERGSAGAASGCGAETKTRYCQPLRHRNHHPPRETLNHFYCIELSLLPAERTSKRVLSVPFSALSPFVFLPTDPTDTQPPPPPPHLVVRTGYSLPSLVLAFLFPSTCTTATLFVLLARREIIRTRKRSHPFGCPNGISSLIREFTAALTNCPSF